jgi:WD40 repeat protein
VFAPDGQTLASASEDQTVRRWNVSTREPVGNPLVHSDHALDAVFTPDGRTLISASFDQRVMFWDTKTGKEAGRNISADVSHVSIDRAGEVLSVASSAWVAVYRIGR